MSVFTAEECEKNRLELMDSNVDMAMIKEIDSEIKVKAYEAYLSKEKWLLTMKVILKIATEISVVLGAVGTIVQIFL